LRQGIPAEQTEEIIMTPTTISVPTVSNISMNRDASRTRTKSKTDLPPAKISSKAKQQNYEPEGRKFPPA